MSRLDSVVWCGVVWVGRRGVVCGLGVGVGPLLVLVWTQIFMDRMGEVEAWSGWGGCDGGVWETGMLAEKYEITVGTGDMTRSRGIRGESGEVGKFWGGFGSGILGEGAGI